MLKSIISFTLVTLSTIPLLATNSFAKEPLRKEFSACEVKTSRPYNSTLVYKNRKFLEGNKLYTADIYKSSSSTKNPKLTSYYYNLKDKGKIVANFRFDYKPTRVNTPNSNQATQTQTPSTNPSRIVWNTSFTACGPRPKDQSYPVISYLFYDTYIGIKLNGYRAPLELGQVTTPNPLRLVNVINQLDGPDFGN